MFGGFASADEDHRNIPPVALAQYSIFVDIHFTQLGAKLRQERRNCSLGFVAQMTARARVQGHLTRVRGGDSPVFWMLAHGFGFEYFWNGPECGWKAWAR